MTRQQIEERAHAIWESEGRPHGRNLDHWLQAEAEIAAVAGRPETPRRAGRRSTAAASRKGKT
jgi:hypothetical protein